jgi:O-antigen/teichoic acid export membrane protein
MSPMMRVIGALLYKFFGAGLQFIITWMTTNMLGAAGRAYLTMTSIHLSVYSPVIGAFSEYIPVGINKNDQDPKRVFGTALWFAMTLAGIVFGATLLLTPWLWHGFGPFAAEKTQSFWVAGLAAPFAMFHVYVTRLIWGLNELEWLNRLNTLQQLLYIPLLLVFIFLGKGEMGKALFAMGAWWLSYMLTSCISAYVTAKKYGISIVPRVDKLIQKDTFQYGIQLVGARMLTITNARIDMYLVFFFIGDTETGVYSLGVTIAEMLTMISGSILQVVMTRMTSLDAKNSTQLAARTFRHTTVIILVIVAAWYLIVPYMIRLLFKPEFEASIHAFRILLPGIALLGIADVLRVYITNQLSRPRVVMYLEGATIAVNVGMSFLLMPKIGYLGTSWAKFSAYAVTFLFTTLYFSRASGYPYWKLFVLQEDEIRQYKNLYAKVMARLRRK